jgi:hemoglobin
VALYDEVGGAPAVRAVLDAFYSRALADGALSHFFLGVDIEQHKQIQEAFFAMALGGPVAYAGRGLAEAHRRTRRRGLNARSFERFVQLFARVLVDRGMTDAQVAQWLAVLEMARPQIFGE